MRQLKIHLVGLSPYLMNNPASMIQKTGGTIKQIPPPETEALSKAYWIDDEHSSLMVPSSHIFGSLIRAAARYKIEKHSLASVLLGACHIEPEFISLNTGNYKIDSRTAIVQKQRIFRNRPKVWPWEIQFEFHFDENWLPLHLVSSTLPKIFETAGKLVGTGDYRIEKKGPFGQYYLKRLELLEQRVEEPLPEPEIVGFDNIVPLPEPDAIKKRKKVSA